MLTQGDDGNDVVVDSVWMSKRCTSTRHTCPTRTCWVRTTSTTACRWRWARALPTCPGHSWAWTCARATRMQVSHDPLTALWLRVVLLYTRVRHCAESVCTFCVVFSVASLTFHFLFALFWSVPGMLMVSYVDFFFFFFAVQCVREQTNKKDIFCPVFRAFSFYFFCWCSYSIYLYVCVTSFSVCVALLSLFVYNLVCLFVCFAHFSWYWKKYLILNTRSTSWVLCEDESKLINSQIKVWSNFNDQHFSLSSEDPRSKGIAFGKTVNQFGYCDTDSELLLSANFYHELTLSVVSFFSCILFRLFQRPEA